MDEKFDNSKKFFKKFTEITENLINWDEVFTVEVPEIETIDLGTNLDEVRDNISKIDFAQPGVHILNLQPGVGKTYTIKSFLKNQKSFLMVTATHKLLSEEYGKIAKHWEGMSHKCEIYNKIEKFHSNNVPIPIICNLQHCDKRKCSYWKQFNTKKAVAPLHYLPTNRVLYKKGEKEFKFDLMVVDEALKEFKSIKLDRVQINGSINVIKKYNPSIESYFDSFIKFINDYDLPTKDQAQYLYNIRNNALKEAIECKKWEDVKQITKLNPYELRKYAYYNSIYKDFLSYPEPFLYFVLDLALQGVPVIFLDATFNKKAFEELLERYSSENMKKDRQLLLDKNIKSITDLKIRVYRSHIKNKAINIYRMDKNNYYYKTGIFDYPSNQISEKGQKIIEELRNYIKRTKRKYNSIGIITYKGLTAFFNDLGETDYFYNLRGSNKIKDVEALFIIGTPQNRIDDVVEGYNNLSLTSYKSENLIKPTYKTVNGKFYPHDPETGEIYTYGVEEKKPTPIIYDHEDLKGSAPIIGKDFKVIRYDYSITEYDYNLSESEKYQALHRARPLIKEVAPIIFIFGDVADKVREEFTLKTLNKKQTSFYFYGPRFKGIYPLPLFRLIHEVAYRTSSLKSLDIAEELRIYKDIKKSGYNTSFITKILNGKVNLKQIKIINNALKNDINSNLNSIKKLLKSSKVDEKFIEDCIFYANEGNFIKY